MNDLGPIGALIARARRRLFLADLLQKGARGVLLAGIALAAIAIIATLIAPWLTVVQERGMWFPLAAGVVLCALVVYTFVTRARDPGDIAVASLVDVRMKLHDRLSTAVAVAHRTDPFACAAVEDALKLACDRRLAEALPRALPIATPKNWWAGPLLCASATAIWWLVPALSFAGTAPAAAQSDLDLQAARDAAKVQIESLQVKIDENPELSKAVAGSESEKRLSADLSDEKLHTPEEVRRETTRKVNELSKRLDELLGGEQAQQLEAMKDALSRIEPAKSGPLQKLAEALKRGDAASAKQELENLQKQLNEGKMDERARKELAAKLQDLAQQLKDAAAAGDALKKALENAGLDGALAKNPQAAKAAIEASKTLNEAQKQALKQALDAQSKAGEKLEKLAKACESMCTQCKNGGSKSGKGASKSGAPGESSSANPSSSEGAAEMAADSLSEMEMLNEMMKDAESARSQCKGSCSSNSPSNTVSDSSKMGANRGRGTGGERTKEETATGTKARKEKVELTSGEVIARQLVDAPPVVGESRAVLQQLSGEIGRGYEEGTEEDPVPANLREVHKHYFGDLKKKIDAKNVQPAASAPAAAPAPAPPSGVKK